MDMAEIFHGRFRDRLDMLPDDVIDAAEKELVHLASKDGKGRDMVAQLALRDFKSIWREDIMKGMDLAVSVANSQQPTT